MTIPIFSAPVDVLQQAGRRWPNFLVTPSAGRASWNISYNARDGLGWRHVASRPWRSSAEHLATLFQSLADDGLPPHTLFARF